MLPTLSLPVPVNRIARQKQPSSRPAGRILRTHEFGTRSLALDAQAWLAPLTQDYPQLRPEAWIVAFAVQMHARAALKFPERWLNSLAGALQVDRERLRLPATLFNTLPRPLFSDPTALSVLYSAALETLAGDERENTNAPQIVSLVPRPASLAPLAHRANRRSAGSVYTPPAIARTILADVQLGARKVLDPACGAGVFLLEAFKRSFARRVEAGAAAEHAAEDVLMHEIGGLDIDEKALAIAEFALRLQGFFSGGLTTDVPIDLRHADALAPLSDLDGQCELIVGNPPFVEGRGLSKTQLASLRERFSVAAVGKVNLFAVFVERALTLLKDNAVLAFVVPSTFQRNTRYKALRELLLRHTIEAITPLDSALFGGRIVETCVLRVRKTPPGIHALVSLGEMQTPQAQLSHGPGLRFCNEVPARMRQQISAMEKRGVPLGSLCEIRDGISTGFQPFPKRLLGTLENDEFVAQDGTRASFDPSIHKRIIDGFEFNAFTPIHWTGRYIDYDKEHEHFPPHPGRPFNCQLRDAALYDRPEKLLTRQTAKGLIATLDRSRFFVRNSVHVTFPRALTSGDLPADVEGHDFDFAARSSPQLSLDALCACLNTRFYSDYLVAVTGENGVVFPQVHIADLRSLPVIPELLQPDGELAQLGAALLDMHQQSIAPSKDIQALMKYVQKFLAEAFEIEA